MADSTFKIRTPGEINCDQGRNVAKSTSIKSFTDQGRNIVIREGT